MIEGGGGDGLWPDDSAAPRLVGTRRRSRARRHPGAGATTDSSPAADSDDATSRRTGADAERGSDAVGEPAAVSPTRVAHPMPATGVTLAQALAAAAPERLSGYDLVEVIAATGRLASWVDAMQLSALAELGRRRPDLEAGWRRNPDESTSTGTGIPTVSEFAPDEVAVALHVSRMSAQTGCSTRSPSPGGCRIPSPPCTPVSCHQ